MGSIDSQKPWVPYMNTKDCSQGFCSLYCPQWCYLFPPPPAFEFPDDDSGPKFSLYAFLLVSYYAIISKYCKNRELSRRENQYPAILDSEENQENAGNHNHEPWHVPTNGLDESLIKSITIFKYKKGDGQVEGTDCSVCLSEFQEDESLRLLPKCNHAFHSVCIDTWLKSHSNCPLCRANIVFISPLPPVSESPSSPLPQPLTNASSLSQTSPESENDHQEDIEMGTSSDEGEQGNIRRRSISMDGVFPSRLSIADILQINDEETDEERHSHSHNHNHGDDDVGGSKGPPPLAQEMSRFNNTSRILHCVTSPIAMKRSFSSGRFLFPKRARGRNIVLPL
ncbi:hypothetical protein M9H77_00366 [Catharanthus roseus]|nr:hypothetical protein M9H77_00366 [Catharanthus roseus]